MGISIAARDYDFDVLDPLKPEDILDLHPMVKHTDPTSSEARTLLEAGKLRLQEQVRKLLPDSYQISPELLSNSEVLEGSLHAQSGSAARGSYHEIAFFTRAVPALF